ncbi:PLASMODESMATA CALLOSE-BINDING PROTEIN 3-like, partial [Nymphaea colorata]|uniref:PLASMODESMATA CALLOSE-BINDING PROTEIN 3-like n=1 Tax=Nymphaea colorata TaxID=210225 RepID=UPI00129EF840
LPTGVSAAGAVPTSVGSSSAAGRAVGIWCVAKPAVPEPIIQEAMDYACGSGADCESIQNAGPCFSPNTLLNHASFAFNSYWQRTKAAGGTCDFGGTAMIVTTDPSYDGCHFLYNV